MKLKIPYKLNDKVSFYINVLTKTKGYGIVKGISFDQSASLRMYIVESEDIKSEEYPYTNFVTPEGNLEKIN